MLKNTGKSKQAAVHSVDYGDGVRVGFMKRISDLTGGAYVHIYKKREFSLMFNDMYKRLKTGYVIEYPLKRDGKYAEEIKNCLGRK